MNADNMISQPPLLYHKQVLPWHALFLVLVGLLGLFKMVNADIWWHLRTGELIFERGSVPRTDWYTYTNPDSPWIDLHWLFQLAAWGTYSLAGSTGLVLTKCLVGMAAFLACLSIRRRNWDASIDMLCWIIPALLFSGRFLVRPEVMTIAFLATTLLVIHSAERRPRLLWCLPAIQLLWVNTQSLFVLQWVVIACYSAELLVKRLFTEASRPPFSLRQWWVAVTATLVATLCNPYFIRGALFPLVVFAKVRGSGREFFHSLAVELRGPMDLVSEHGLARVIMQPTSLLFIALFCAALSVTLLRWKRGEFEIFRILLLLGFSYLAIQMSRNIALFAIVAGYVFRWNLGELVEMPGSTLGKKSLALRGSLRPIAGLLMLATIVLVGSGGYHSRMRTLPTFEFGIGESDWYPHAAGKQLLAEGMPDRFYAQHLGIAAVCLKHASPEKRVFVDARLETHSRETLSAYLSVQEGLSLSRQSALDVLAEGLDPMEWPAIVIANDQLAAQPRMVQFISQHPDWVCVHSSPPAGLNLGNPGISAIGGASVFISRKRWAASAISLADPGWLLVVARNRIPLQR